MNYTSFVFHDDGTYPNNDLPSVLLKQAIKSTGSIDPGTIEKIFHENNWENSWGNGLYPFHQYHSTAHDAYPVILPFKSFMTLWEFILDG